MDALEQLLAEFFGPSTSTERKRTIETQLDAQRLTLDDCQYILTHGRSDYAAWFATSQFQKRIQEEWSGLDPAVQHSHRSFLLRFLQQQSEATAGPTRGPGPGISAGTEPVTNGVTATSPLGTTASAAGYSPFVLNKVVQLLTDIALLDWPDRFQILFPEIHRFLQSKEKHHALLGWTLLEAVVQEFVGACPVPGSGKSHRVHLTLSRQKRYLWEQFKTQVPDLLNLIVQHLDTCYNQTLVAPLSTEAPAPSPVEHSLWGTSQFGRRPSAAGMHTHLQMSGSFQNSLSGSRAVPGSMSSSFAAMNPPGSALGQSALVQDNGQRQAAQGDTNPYGKSPTTMLRKSLSQFLGGPGNPSSPHGNDSGSQLNPVQSPAGSSLYMLHARQRMGSISDLGQIAMRRSSINALMMESRRNSIESTFVSGSRMDSHSRKTCMMALRTLTTLLSCPGLDPRQVSFSASISTVLRFATLHQNKTVELGILALSCLNGLVARPGYLATNQEALTSSVRIMADLIRYFNEVKDGVDDIDESYLQMFMHFVSLFCTWTHLERAEKALGVSIPDFLASFSRFTLEKVSVDYLKVCMDVWKSLLDALIQSASDLSRPIPAQHPLRRVQGAVLVFMSELVDKFYKMKGALRSEDAFTTFEVEDEEDLEDLTELVQSFVGLIGELFTEEVIEMLNPLLTQQLELYSRRELDECKTLPITLGILSRVAYNFLQDFEHRREYTSNLIIHLTRMTKLSMEYYLAAISDASNFGKDGPDLTGTTTLALFDCLIPLIPWLNHLWKFETDPAMHNDAQTITPIARDIYQELAQICSDLFRKLLPMSSSKGLPEQSLIPSSTMDTFLGPASGSCSALDRKLLLVSVRTLNVLTLHVRIPASLLTAHSFSFWGLDSIRELASSLSQNLMTNSNFMGIEFVPSETTAASEDEERKGITPNDELFCLAYVALSNGIALDPKADQDHQAYGNLVAPAIYPLQSILQESRTSQGNFMDSSEVKSRVHRSLTVLRALINSVTEASVASRTVVYEGLKSALPLVHEYFEIYTEDHGISIDILLFFRTLVKSLYRQVGEGHCMELARVLMERLTSPPLLESALSQTHQHLHQSLHQRSFVLQQQKVVERIHLSLSILKAILELPGKDVTIILPEFLQFLLIQLGPKLVGAQHQQLNNDSSKPIGSLGIYQETNQGMQEEGLDVNVNDLLALFYTTIQTLLTRHSRFFFVNARAMPAAGGQDVNDHDNQRAQALQKCMEFLAHGLHCPEPDLVRRTIEILLSLQDHNLCRLFERSEFQLNFRFEFLQILLRLALSHQQDLLLEEIAGLIHKMVKGDQDGDEKFLSVWNGDLKRFVAALEPHHVLTTASSASTSAAAVSSTGSPQPGLPGDSSSSRAAMLSNARYSDAMKEALWMDIARLGDSSTYREGLYDFVNDAQVYAQSLVA